MRTGDICNHKVVVISRRHHDAAIGGERKPVGRGRMTFIKVGDAMGGSGGKVSAV